jgi:tRNA(His) 5'-end guanylyltransferase
MEENTTLKDKCREYQKRRDYHVDTDKFIIAHIDGRSFSKMIKNKFQKPFDVNFIDMMNKTAQYLCQMVQGTHLAYVQSDEITLIIKKNTEDSDVFFGGRLCKMQSIIASLATAKFNQLMTAKAIQDNMYETTLMDFEDTIYNPSDCVNAVLNMALCQFDCKIWDVDNANDAMAWLLFRNIDCTRNSKQQTCQTYLSHKELMSKHTDEQVALLLEEKGINWFDLPDGQKYGRLIQKQMVTEERTFSTKDGIERTESCVRSKWQIIDGFDLTVSANRERITEMYPIFKDEGTV